MRTCNTGRLQVYAAAAASAFYLMGSTLFFHHEMFTSRYTKAIGGDPYIKLLSLVRNRTQIHRDEFFKRGPSEDAISAYFRFDDSLYSDDNVKLDPLWKCASRITQEERHLNGERKRKLIFLHIPRTAGSTIRALLRAYSSYCHAGFAAVSRCVDLSVPQMHGIEIWRNGRVSHAAGKDCILTDYANRTDETWRIETTTPSEEYFWPRNVSTALLKDMQVDILSGELPLGSDEYWYTTDSNGKQEPADVQYVVFFRQPLEKFVSEVMFRKAGSVHLSIEEAAGLVHEVAVNAMSAGRYREKYSNYLITPRQKDWVEREDVRWTPEHRVNLTLTNLVSKKILVGLVERMPESFELLRYILDRENEVPRIFQFFSASDKVSKFANVATRNRTNAIVKRIFEDESRLARIVEYLKYDTQIYEFAREIHEKQYHRLNNESSWNSSTL